MGLRFINPAAYSKRWFRSLGSVFRDIFWYIWCTCDDAGVWEIDTDLVHKMLGVTMNVQQFVAACNSCDGLLPGEKADEHVRLLADKRHLWIIYFIVQTQRNGLSPETESTQAGLVAKNTAHRPIYASLRKFVLLEEVRGQFKAIGVQQQGELEVAAEDEHFNKFWAVYPNKDAKQAAQKAWRKVVGTNGVKLLPLILVNVKARLECGQWNIKEKRFIPHGSTYLNQRRWNDEPQGRKRLTDKDHQTGEW